MRLILIGLFFIFPNLSNAYLNEQTSGVLHSKRLSKEKHVSIQETSDTDGVIRHVSWQGPHHPDIKNLLGPCFVVYDDFIKGNTQLRMRGAVTIERDGCHINIGGHMRNVRGEVSLDK